MKVFSIRCGKSKQMANGNSYGISGSVVQGLA
jgi:hypothetical protein